MQPTSRSCSGRCRRPGRRAASSPLLRQPPPASPPASRARQAPSPSAPARGPAGPRAGAQALRTPLGAATLGSGDRPRPHRGRVRLVEHTSASRPQQASPAVEVPFGKRGVLCAEPLDRRAGEETSPAAPQVSRKYSCHGARPGAARGDPRPDPSANTRAGGLDRPVGGKQLRARPHPPGRSRLKVARGPRPRTPEAEAPLLDHCDDSTPSASAGSPFGTRQDLDIRLVGQGLVERASHPGSGFAALTTRRMRARAPALCSSEGESSSTSATTARPILSTVTTASLATLLASSSSMGLPFVPRLGR